MEFTVIENNRTSMREVSMEDPIWSQLKTLTISERKNVLNISENFMILSRDPLDMISFERIITQMVSVTKLEFDILMDDPKWTPVLYVCIMNFAQLEELIYGRLVFRTAHQFHLRTRRDTLKNLTIHCVENGYHIWLSTFFENMDIHCLSVDRFSIMWDDNRIYESSFLLENCNFTELIIRGLISPSAFCMNPIFLRRLSLYSPPKMPYAILDDSYHDISILTNLTCLKLPYADLTDNALQIICTSMRNLQTLDISGNLSLSSNRLRDLRNLKSLESLSVAYLPITHQDLNLLTFLSYLDISYVSMYIADITRLIYQLPNLRTVINFCGMTKCPSEMNRYLRDASIILMNRTVDCPIMVYGDQSLVTAIAKKKDNSLKDIFFKYALDETNPIEIKRVVGMHFGQQTLYTLVDGFWRIRI